MALSKIIDLGNGVSVSYHKVVNVQSDFCNTSNVSVTVYSYVSKDIRDEGVDLYIPNSRVYTFTGPVSGDIRTWVYDQLKGLPEWTDSTDI